MFGKRMSALLLAVCCGSSISCSGSGVDLYGAGATFPAPLYKRWFLEYYKLHPDVRVNYQAIGSGAGIRQFSANLVNFGASDAAMSDKEIDKAMEENPNRKGILLLPMTAGSIALCYNLPGNISELKLSRQVYTDIFLGKITSWDDPAIAKLNPGLDLPELEIAVVRRADGSGTTFAFTNHLSAISPEWKEKVGVGKAVTWPVGIGGNGNAGVAAWIQQTPGAIGYLEYGYAELSNLSMASLENKSGRYVLPTLETGQAALADVKMPENLRAFLPDPPGANAYPLVTYTWLLCFKDYSDRPAEAAALRDVIRYCLTDGQRLSTELGYIPLPPEVAKRVLKAVDEIQG
jgi:phosphate transport system substrate-binding protein